MPIIYFLCFLTLSSMVPVEYVLYARSRGWAYIYTTCQKKNNSKLLTTTIAGHAPKCPTHNWYYMIVQVSAGLHLSLPRYGFTDHTPFHDPVEQPKVDEGDETNGAHQQALEEGREGERGRKGNNYLVTCIFSAVLVNVHNRKSCDFITCHHVILTSTTLCNSTRWRTGGCVHSHPSTLKINFNCILQQIITATSIITLIICATKF